MSKSYIQRIRNKLGSDHFICPGARIIIENEQGEFLFILRKDNGNWGIPAGGLEDNETILECIKREVKEETNINLLHAELIGISSLPSRETVSYPNGDVVQYFTSVFYSNNWSGEVKPDDKEVKEILFSGIEDIDRLPDNERSSFEFLKSWLKDGRVVLE